MPSRLARAMIWMERMESPPSSKKLSLIETWLRPSVEAKMEARACSMGEDGRMEGQVGVGERE